jgi:hypothetical protein
MSVAAMAGPAQSAQIIRFAPVRMLLFPPVLMMSFPMLPEAP